MIASGDGRNKARFDSRDDPSISKMAAPANDAPVERRLESSAVFHRQIIQTIRRTDLRRIVPLADTTIYEMEQRGEFPRRFYLTPRCVVWDLAEVEAWIEARRRASDASVIMRAPSPDVRQRKARPVLK